MTFHEARRLWESKQQGASFSRTITVGRLELFLHPRELRMLRRACGANPADGSREPLAGYRFGEYADRFLRECCGASQLEVIDYSDYEGATIVHDLNEPIPEALRNGFDAVIEGGSLEHIFNFPVAIRNLMQLVKPGGTVFLTVPANNLCGHGFYQFSPELLYRVFSAQNGFELSPVVFLEAAFPGIELAPVRRAYAVTDPMLAGRRVGLRSRRPVVMMMQARKIRDADPLAQAPQQSDYTVRWDRSKDPSGSQATLRRVAARLPKSWQYRLQGHYWNWQYSLRNRSFYQRVW